MLAPTSSSRCGDPLAGAITTVGHQQADRLNSRLQRAQLLQQESNDSSKKLENHCASHLQVLPFDK